jgi:DNA modification methylase
MSYGKLSSNGIDFQPDNFEVCHLETMSKLDRYRAFVKRKAEISRSFGLEVDDSEVHPKLKPHQRDSVRWGVRGGRRAWFLAFGLGKTVIQLEALRLILKKAKIGKPGLIVAPLGVRQEFRRDAKMIDLSVKFIRSSSEIENPDAIYLTNYETVRDGKLDPTMFAAASLDEAAILRGFGGVKTFREFMVAFEPVPYRFVATATPDPNEYIELLAYSAYLGIMDVSQAKTRFFKRDSVHADRLTIHPHKEQEFWLWCATWALFLARPSDLGPEYSDEGYLMPDMQVIHHEIRAGDRITTADRGGQYRLIQDASLGVVDAAKEKRAGLDERLAEVRAIIEANPKRHHILWHDLEDERRALENIEFVSSVYGSQDLDEREQIIIDFASGKLRNLAGKPSMIGSGPNFQHHCHVAIFCGIGFKFADFIQAIHRIVRYLQKHKCEIHLIYTDLERGVLAKLMQKWEAYKKQVNKMSAIIKEYGLAELSLAQALARQEDVERFEIVGENYTLVCNDSVAETIERMPDNSMHLILTSIPFGTMYEYSPHLADFGHTNDPAHFWEQMDFLIPELLRVLQPGRLAAIHVKDRIVPGGLTGRGFQTVYPFHADAIREFTKHGFGYMGMKTIVTDVVRENNQTYRLGWSEQCKDGSKMGVGMPEYLLVFRKNPTDKKRSYADNPVVKLKRKYSRSRWQIDAHGFTRASGNRLLTPEEIESLPHSAIFKLFRDYSLTQVYDFEHHVHLGEALEHYSFNRGVCNCVPGPREASPDVLADHRAKCRHGRLPVTFMLLQPASWHPDVWTDITRMMTLNAAQSAKGREMHLCPMQFDLADRVIAQYTMEGETVLDPFGGLMTVPYRALKLKRKAIGIELNRAYLMDGAKYCEAAAREVEMPSLFDVPELIEIPESVPDNEPELAATEWTGI